MAARARHVELHAPAGLCDLAAASALRTFAGGLDVSLTVAVAAGVTTRDIQSHDAAANRRPERNVDLIFEIGAGLGTFFGHSCPAASAEDAGENVTEAAAART